MCGTRPVITWVADSVVRIDVVEAIAGQTLGTGEILERVEASESAVYAALNDLERRGLVAESETGWIATGRGRLVADVLDQQRTVDGLFGNGDDYWQTHDVSVLPRRLRLRLDALEGYEIVRITETDPRRVVREVTELIDTAEWTRILAPIYRDEYATTMPDNDESQLVLDTRVVEDALETTVKDPEAERPEATEIRLGSAPVGLTVTPEVVMVSFPTLDGSYDNRTELRIETDAAREWGHDLFEHYWEQSVPAPDS